MSKFKVTFQPDNKTVEVEAGTTLLQAAEAANVYINSLCGGEGLCGECRLQVLKGNARADKRAIGFFSAEELKHGYVLACQTKVNDNLEVMVPARSRLEMEKIITEGTQVSYSEPTHEAVEQPAGELTRISQPLVVKVFLELPEPTMT
ncbi:MAG: 2Fe-2S iron-sulfur cluster binding domain-containing protein, partial [Dehalococcoidales bacterium]|nr:2Fe-2S iron-sulfur cluster binding domain-containing protein [Dehalococcoidales bacterium]